MQKKYASFLVFIGINAIILISSLLLHSSDVLFLLIPLFYALYLVSGFNIKTILQFAANVFVVSFAVYQLHSKQWYIAGGIFLISTITLSLTLEFILKRNVQKKSTKANHIVSSIFKQITQHEQDEKTLNATCHKIIEILQTNYGMDYCTIFHIVDRSLSIAASNVPEKYWRDLNEHIEKKHADVGRILTVKDISTTLEYPTAIQREIRYMQFIPLATGKRLNGAVLIENKVFNEGNKTEAEIYEVVLESISMVMKYIKYQDKIYSMAMKDALSGLYNRQYLNERLRYEFSENTKLRKPVTVCMVDIDHFKKVNDTYGHAFGDIVIKTVSEYIMSNIREDDTAVRLGGEEILLYYPRPHTLIQNRLDIIRKGISEINFVNDTGTVVNITVSLGAAEYPTHGISLDEVIENADKALYYSKSHGRNKATFYDDILDKT